MGVDVQDIVESTVNQIKRAKIRKPAGTNEFVGPCHWSKTGWAIWRRDGNTESCTCQPAKKPSAKWIRVHYGNLDVLPI